MKKKKDRDIEKEYSVKQTVAKLRKLADCLENAPLSSSSFFMRFSLTNHFPICFPNQFEAKGIQAFGPTFWLMEENDKLA